MLTLVLTLAILVLLLILAQLRSANSRNAGRRDLTPVRVRTETPRIGRRIR